MFASFLRLLFVLPAAFFLWLGSPAAVQAQTQTPPNPEEIGKIAREMEALDQMRSQLASTIEDMEGKPTMQTMKEVCAPVGKRAKQLSQENIWNVKQVADKYRNPDHAPATPEAQEALDAFRENPNLISYWQKEELHGEPGLRYYRRINVEPACLACHGDAESRPDFVKKGYPEDLAFNFEVGDLRGMYAVFLPEDVQAGLQKAVK